MRIAVAMSGGVDSSVVAKMMVGEGHEVIGLFLKLWADTKCDIKRDNRCCDYQALEDARSVAAKLKIPFYVINAEKEFKKEVVDYFLEEYKNLRTPNPCIVCNDKIKFDLLLKKALQLGCEKLCTGHYARIGDPGNSKSQAPNIKQNPNSKFQTNNVTMKQWSNTYRLYTGIDETKDQSYMLYRLSQDQLSKVLFPLGEMTKKEVRALAVKWDLPVKEKPESQEICFVAEKDYREFLKRYLDEKYFKPGDIVNQSGDVFGHHGGLVNYTVGQRKGIEQIGQKSKVQSPKSKENPKSKVQNEDRKPLYVVGFDVEKNQLIVGEDKETYKDEMTVGKLAFVDPNSQFLIHNSNLRVKIRYRHPAVPISKISNPKSQITNKSQEPNYKTTIEQCNIEIIAVVFRELQRAVTPGQSAVFYLHDQVLGGGIIEG